MNRNRLFVDKPSKTCANAISMVKNKTVVSERRAFMKSTCNLSFLMLTLIATLPAYAVEPKPITDVEVNAVQQAWCDGLLKIGQIHKEGVITVRLPAL